jgi:uncharacterized protein (TIRG00374 family)
MRHRWIVVGLGCAASVVFMYMAVRRLDFASVYDVFLTIRIWPWIPLGVLSYLTGHLVRGLRCRLLLRRHASLGAATAANVVVVGYAANNVFPARLGELVRAGMLSERTGIPIAQSLTVTFIERVLDGLAILSLLLLGMAAGGAPGWVHDLARVGLLVFGIAFAATMLAVQAPAAIVAVASRIGNRLSERWHDRLVRFATSIVSGVACLRDPRDAALIGAYSLLVWVLETGLFAALLPAFGLPMTFGMGSIAMSITNLGLLVPSTPGFIGPFHYFCSRALIAEGVPEAVSLAYATVVHLTFYVPVTLWGAVAMLWYGVEVGATATVARAARFSVCKSEINGLLVHEVAPLEKVRADEDAPSFVRAVVEALVSTDQSRVEPAILNTTANFVHGQLQALPRSLGLMFETGMTVFRLLTRARFLRGYCDLPLATRRRWTGAWANSRYALFRKLFKPLRATALLAYYEELTPERVIVSSVLVRREARAGLAAADGMNKRAETSR